MGDMANIKMVGISIGQKLFWENVETFRGKSILLNLNDWS